MDPSTEALDPLPDGGPFVVEQRLGHGRTAEVFAARRRTDGRSVALKVARATIHEASLFAEFAVAGAVAHAHLVAPEALTRLPDGRLALVMDRVDGGALAEVALAPDARLEVAAGVVRAVCVLHGRGGHHGDLSPHNVLVERGRVARLIDATPGDRNARVGTPGYIAPEVLAGAPQDARADLYALGCLVFEIITGGPLFDVPADRLTHAHLHRAPALPPSVPPAIAEALRGVLAKAPDERSAGAERLLDALTVEAGRPPADELEQLGRAIISGDRVVGRAEARRPLQAALDALDDGRGSACWTWGASGAGRTALRRWAAAEVARRGAMPVELVGAPVDPLAAAAEAIGLGVGAGAAQAHAVTAAWIDAAEQAPRCVLVDLDAPDPVTLRALVEALAAAARLAPLAVLVFAGDAHAPTGVPAHGLTPLISAERRGIVFDRLGHDDPAAQLVAEALDDSDIDRPGHLVGALDGLIAAGILARAPGAWTVDRSRLQAERTAIIDRALRQAPVALTRCSAIERRVLAAFAVAGEPLDDGALADFAGRAGLAAAGDLEDRRIVLERDGILRPVRAGLARAARDGLEPDALAELHRIAAARARVSGADADAVRHRVLAGDPVPVAERVSAAEALVAAGRSAAALDALGAAPADDVAGGAALCIAEARVRMAQGRTDDALAALDRAGPGEQARLARLRLLTRAGRHQAAVDAARPDRDPPALRAWTACARLWMGDGEGAAADAQALYDAEPPSVPRALAAHVLATLAWRRGALAEAEGRVLDALEWVGDDDDDLVADLSRTLGGVRIYRGDFTGAEPPLERAVALDRALGRVPELAKSLNNTGIMFYQRGDYPAARAAFEEYRLLCGRIDNPVELANVSNNLGVLALKLGEPARAEALCRAAEELARGADYGWMVPVAGSNRGAALIALGQLDAAEAALREAREGLAAQGIEHELMELERRWIELAIARSHPGRARALAEALLADPRLADVPVEAAHVRRLLAECAMGTGDMSDARALVEDAIERFDALGCRHESAMARETRARVKVATGKFESAILDVRRALEVHKALGTRADLDRAGDLLDEAEERYRRSDQSVRHAQILLELSLALGGAREVDRLLPAAVDAVLDLVGAERGLVALYRPDGALDRAVVRNLDWEGPDSPLPVSESIVDETLRERRVVLVQDAVDSGAIWDRTSVALLGLRSIVCVPILDRSAALGVLYLDSRRLVVTDLDAEVELLSGVARIIGLAVANARLFEATRHRMSAVAGHAHMIRAELDALAEAGETVADVESPDARRALSDRIVEAVDRLSATADMLLTSTHDPVQD